MRVLIAAENASARLGGEATLPYHYFRLLRGRGVDAHLVVHARVCDELGALLSEERERIHFVEDMALQKLLYRMGRLLPRRVDEATLGLATQLLTQYAQRGILRRLTNATSVIHQPIPVAPRFPSLLYGLGAPVVIGPLNGGMEYPPALRAEPFFTRVAVALARGMSDVANTLLPGKRRAAVVLVANERTRAALPKGIRGTVVELAENGVDLACWRGDEVPPQAAETSRFVFVGRLVDWKALDIAIDALSQVEGATLEVVGDGPMLAAWRQRATDAGVSARVRFEGWRSQAECAQRLRGCRALLLPSIFECGGAVVLEAMACGRPVIATAWGGPLDYLDARSGILIEPSSRDAMVRGFRDAMQRLRDSSQLCRSLGAAGRDRVTREFDWEKKIDRILQIYAQALQR